MFSLPAGTGMFRFPAFASPSGDDGFFSRRVAPFGLPRVNGHLHLAGVFRGLSRPSSPPGARASTARPRSLNSSILANASCLAASRRGLFFFSLPHCTVVLSRLFLSPSRFSSHHVKELQRLPSRCRDIAARTGTGLASRSFPRPPLSRVPVTRDSLLFSIETRRALETTNRGNLSAPERRCSSRTFRYGYLVTT